MRDFAIKLIDKNAVLKSYFDKYKDAFIIAVLVIDPFEKHIRIYSINLTRTIENETIISSQNLEWIKYPPDVRYFPVQTKELAKVLKTDSDHIITMFSEEMKFCINVENVKLQKNSIFTIPTNSCEFEANSKKAMMDYIKSVILRCARNQKMYKNVAIPDINITTTIENKHKPDLLVYFSTANFASTIKEMSKNFNEGSKSEKSEIVIDIKADSQELYFTIAADVLKQQSSIKKCMKELPILLPQFMLSATDKKVHVHMHEEDDEDDEEEEEEEEGSEQEDDSEEEEEEEEDEDDSEDDDDGRYRKKKSSKKKKVKGKGKSVKTTRKSLIDIKKGPGRPRGTTKISATSEKKITNLLQMNDKERRQIIQQQQIGYSILDQNNQMVNCQYYLFHLNHIAQILGVFKHECLTIGLKMKSAIHIYQSLGDLGESIFAISPVNKESDNYATMPSSLTKSLRNQQYELDR